MISLINHDFQWGRSEWGHYNLPRNVYIYTYIYIHMGTINQLLTRGPHLVVFYHLTFSEKIQVPVPPAGSICHSSAPQSPFLVLLWGWDTDGKTPRFNGWINELNGHVKNNFNSYVGNIQWLSIIRCVYIYIDDSIVYIYKFRAVVALKASYGHGMK